MLMCPALLTLLLAFSGAVPPADAPGQGSLKFFRRRLMVNPNEGPDIAVAGKTGTYLLTNEASWHCEENDFRKCAGAGACQ
jgi:hypothetical protein